MSPDRAAPTGRDAPGDPALHDADTAPAAADDAPRPAASAGGAQALRLEGDYTIYRAAELRTELLREFEGGARRFDLSGIVEFDAAGLQLLAALRASADAKGGRIEFLAPPPSVRDVLALCGLADWLGDAAHAGRIARSA